MPANPSARSLADRSAVWLLPRLTERLLYAQQHQLPRLQRLAWALTMHVEGESLSELCSMLEGLREAAEAVTWSGEPTRWWARSDKKKKQAAQEEAVSTVSMNSQHLGECVAAFQEESKRQQDETRVLLTDLLLEVMELESQSTSALQELGAIYQDVQTRCEKSPPPVVKHVLRGLMERARVLRSMLDLQNGVCVAARLAHEGCTRVVETRTVLGAAAGRKVCSAQTELLDTLRRLSVVQPLQPHAEKLRKLVTAKVTLAVQVEEASIYLGEAEEARSLLQQALTDLHRNMTSWQALSPSSKPISGVDDQGQHHVVQAGVERCSQ